MRLNAKILSFFKWYCTVNFQLIKVIFKVQHITVKRGHFYGLLGAGKTLIVVPAVSGLGYR